MKNKQQNTNKSVLIKHRCKSRNNTYRNFRIFCLYPGRASYRVRSWGRARRGWKTTIRQSELSASWTHICCLRSCAQSRSGPRFQWARSPWRKWRQLQQNTTQIEWEHDKERTASFLARCVVHPNTIWGIDQRRAGANTHSRKQCQMRQLDQRRSIHHKTSAATWLAWHATNQKNRKGRAGFDLTEKLKIKLTLESVWQTKRLTWGLSRNRLDQAWVQRNRMKPSLKPGIEHKQGTLADSEQNSIGKRNGISLKKKQRTLR